MKRAMGAALAACLIAGACSCTSTGPSDAGSQEVRVLVAGDPEELEVYRALVEGFHEAQDEVRVRLEEAPDRDVLLTQLATAIAAGRPPDVFLLNYRYTGRFISTDAVLALDDRLAASSVLSEDAFYRTPLEAFRADGRQMCLPQNAASLVVYWNEDLFEAAGVEGPSDDWTWDEMVEAATALTTDDDGDGAPDVYGLGVDPEILRLAPLIWSAGGELVDDDDAPTTFALRSAAALGAIRRFLELRVVHGVTPTEEEAESEDHVTRFSAGRLGMLMESRRVVPSIRAGATFAWDVAPFPILDEPATVLHSDGYCITSASARPDAAWTFVEYALGPEGQRITAEAGRTVPSLIEVAESDAFVDPSTMPPSSEVYLDQLDVARPVPATAAWPRVEDTANAILEEAYYEPSQRAEAGEVALSIIRATSGMFTGGGS